MKKHPDSNLEKTLANLESHPALLKRCQQLYLEKVIESKTCVEIAEEHGLNVSTVSRYIGAYKKTTEKYFTSPTITDVLAFCNAEIGRLLKRREEVETHRDYKDLTGEVRQFQEMVNEVSGLINRKTDVNIRVVNNMVSMVTETLPYMLESNLGKTITKELINEMLESFAQKLEDSTAEAS